MANEEQFNIIKSGISQWNEWRQQHPEVNVDLRGAYLAGVDLTGVNLIGANLSGADLRATLTEADLRGANLRDANLCANLMRANLGGADLQRADLTQADLTEADLQRADLQYATLREAKLNGAKLAHAYCLNANLRGASLTKADLTEATLMGADLTKAGLSWAVLIGTKLMGADLTEAGPFEADLTGADLSGTILFRTAFAGANLSETVLYDASFKEAYLVRANFQNAECNRTSFKNTDLSASMGLDTIRHSGPSTLGIDTLYRSKGNIPEIFLRGCGVPDDMIAYIRSIKGAIQYYTVFISYSSKNRDFSQRLYNDLQGAGIRCWFDQGSLKGGELFWEVIDQAIIQFDKVIVVLSEDAIKSPNVEREVLQALAKEQQLREQDIHKTVLFPITLDDSYKTITTGWAVDIWHTRHILDFTAWKSQDDYQAAFAKLLDDLKTTP